MVFLGCWELGGQGAPHLRGCWVLGIEEDHPRADISTSSPPPPTLLFFHRHLNMDGWMDGWT